VKRSAGYIVLSVAAFVALTVCLCIPARAITKDAEFSATLVMESGGTTSTGKTYFTKIKQRTDINDAQSGQDAIAIIRLDKKVMWSLIPAEKIYMEMPINQQQTNPLTGDENVVKRERIGKEKVDGHPSIKEKVTVKDQDGTTTQMYWWQATDIGWPIKAEAIDGSWSYTYKDIKMGRQDPALFDVPKDYQKMTMPDMQAPGRGYPEQAAPEYPEPPAPDYPQPPTPDYPEPPPIPDTPPDPPAPDYPQPPSPDFYIPSPF